MTTNWNKRYAAENCKCHGWPKLQCPNVPLDEKHLISEVERMDPSIPSIADTSTKTKKYENFFGDDL
jgi:hypothetical protein